MTASAHALAASARCTAACPHDACTAWGARAPAPRRHYQPRIRRPSTAQLSDRCQLAIKNAAGTSSWSQQPGAELPPATAFQLSSAPGAQACIYSGPLPFVVALRSHDLRHLLEVTSSGMLRLTDASGRLLWSAGSGALGASGSSGGNSTGATGSAGAGNSSSRAVAPAGGVIRVAAPPAPLPPASPRSGAAPAYPAFAKATAAGRVSKAVQQAAASSSTRLCLSADGSLSLTADSSGEMSWGKPAPASYLGWQRLRWTIDVAWCPSAPAVTAHSCLQPINSRADTTAAA
jgi:hypothetical protein